MKKSKLLMPIIASTAIVGTMGMATATLASCSCSNHEDEGEYIEKAVTDINIVGNNMAAYFQFILKDKLTDDQVITAEYGDTGLFTFAQPEVSGRLITVPVYWLQVDSHTKEEKIVPITFTCKNKNNDEVYWTQTIEGAKVTYLPYCTLDGQKDITSDKVNGNTMVSQFKFTLPNGIPSTYPSHLVVDVDDSYTDNMFAVDKNPDKTFIEYDSSTFTATVTITATRKEGDNVADGDSFKCDIQISCMYGQTDIPIWISSKFRELSVAYNSAPNEIPADKLIFAPYGDSDLYLTLVGIETTNPDGYNTLKIPATDPETGKMVIAIGDGTNPVGNLPSTITKLVFTEGSYLTYFRKNCFNNANSFKYIDVSAIGDDTEGLEEMTFEENSFAGWSENGTVIWGNDFSQYKRHMLMMGLYKGGLTQSGWYKMALVDSESELREACATGTNVKLVSDITIKKQVDNEGNSTYMGQINIEKDMLIDLNGYTVTSEDPIYNNEAKQFAIFGIWHGADVVVTDSYDGTDPNRQGVKPHSGSVKAFDQRINYLNTATWPVEGDKENACWDYATDLKKWRPRESRAFYIRTDTPTADETSLWILGGSFYGNCTTIFNCNGSCWIEESFKSYDPVSGEELHQYAPQFHTLSPFRTYNKGDKNDNGSRELLNCDDTESAKGTAYFEVYGGKFYGTPLESDPNQYDYYLPSKAAADTDWEGQCPANWLASHRYHDIFECFENEFKDEYGNSILVTTKRKI